MYDVAYVLVDGISTQLMTAQVHTYVPTPRG